MLGQSPINWMSELTEVCRMAWSEDDYQDGGLRYCKECRTPKQIEHDMGEYGKHLFACFCSCELQRRQAETLFAEERERIKRKERLRMAALELPEQLNATFENDDSPDSKVSVFMRRYLDNWPKMIELSMGMVLTGSVGTGKSYIAAALVNAIIDKGDRAEFVSVPEVVAMSRQANSWNKAERSDYDRFMDKVRTYELLVLDDLGAERDTPFAIEQVYRVIEERSNAGLPLIVTTNLSVTQMRERPTLESSRIYDRIDKMCPLVFEITGKSRRKAVGDERKQLAQQIMQGK